MTVWLDGVKVDETPDVTKEVLARIEQEQAETNRLLGQVILGMTLVVPIDLATVEI